MRLFVFISVLLHEVRSLALASSDVNSSAGFWEVQAIPCEYASGTQRLMSVNLCRSLVLLLLITNFLEHRVSSKHGTPFIGVVIHHQYPFSSTLGLESPILQSNTS